LPLEIYILGAGKIAVVIRSFANAQDDS